MPAQMVSATNWFILNTFAALAASRKGRKVNTAIETEVMTLKVGSDVEAPNAIKMLMKADRKPQPASAGTMGLKMAATVSKKRVSSEPFLLASSDFKSRFSSMASSSSTPVSSTNSL